MGKCRGGGGPSLVPKPWRTENSLSIEVCPSFLSQMGSTSTSLFGAAAGFPRAVKSAAAGDKMLWTSSFTSTSSFISLQLAVSGYPWTATAVSQPDLLIYRPKRSPGDRILAVKILV